MQTIAGIAQPQAVRAVFFDVGYTLLSPHPCVPDIVSAVCAESSGVEDFKLPEPLPGPGGRLQPTTSRANPRTTIVLEIILYIERKPNS